MPATTALASHPCRLVLAATSRTAARPAAALDSPSTVVQHTSDRVIAVLSDKSLSTPEQRRKVETIVYEYFDFVTLSKLVLARNWKQLTPEQQAAFIEEFKQHLSITYGRNLERYNNEKVAVTGEREETGGDYTVKSKVLRPGAEDVLVDYRLRQQDGAWKVIDVVIEGVSLVANFRSQFQEVLAGGGPDKLIRLLHEKNEKGEPLKSYAAPVGARHWSEWPRRRTAHTYAGDPAAARRPRRQSLAPRTAGFYRAKGVGGTHRPPPNAGAHVSVPLRPHLVVGVHRVVEVVSAETGEAGRGGHLPRQRFA